VGVVIRFPGDKQVLRSIEEKDLTPQNDDEPTEDPVEIPVATYIAKLVKTKNPQTYLDILKEFMDTDEYELTLLAIMDRDYLEQLDDLVFVHGYFKLLGFDPEDPRAA
jgi:hypothetical protein